MPCSFERRRWYLPKFESPIGEVSENILFLAAGREHMNDNMLLNAITLLSCAQPESGCMVQNLRRAYSVLVWQRMNSLISAPFFSQTTGCRSISVLQGGAGGEGTNRGIKYLPVWARLLDAPYPHTHADVCADCTINTYTTNGESPEADTEGQQYQGNVEAAHDEAQIIRAAEERLQRAHQWLLFAHHCQNCSQGGSCGESRCRCASHCQ